MKEEIAEKWPWVYKIGAWSLGGFIAFLLAMKGTAVYNATGGVLLGCVLFCFYKTRKAGRLPDKAVLLALAAFAGGLLLSSLLQGEWQNIEGSLHYAYFMLNVFIVYIGVRMFGRKEILCKAIVVAAAVTAVVCVVSYFNPQAWMGGRFSPTINPNVAVQLMALPVPFTVVAIYRLRKFKLWCGIALVALLLVLTAVGLTRSRGGITGLLAGLLAMGSLYWPIVKSKWSDKRKLIVSILATCLVSLLAVSITVHVFSRGHSDQARVHLLQSAAQMFVDHPVTGVGYENWKKEYPHYMQPKAKNPKLPTAHNDLMNLMAATGILGGGGYVIFSLAIWLYLLWRMVKQPKEAMLWAMMWMFISVYIHGLVDISIQHSQTARMFYGMLGLTLAIADEEQENCSMTT